VLYLIQIGHDLVVLEKEREIVLILVNLNYLLLLFLLLALFLDNGNRRRFWMNSLVRVFTLDAQDFPVRNIVVRLFLFLYLVLLLMGHLLLIDILHLLLQFFRLVDVFLVHFGQI
jgi:hypothetical protein